MASNPHEMLPPKPLVFHILLVLISKECHGYAIVRQLAEQTDGHLNVEPGNLYRTLRTMAAEGLIEESATRPDADLDDQRRRYFRITKLGDEVLQAEAARMERLAASAKAQLEAARPGAGAR